MNKVLMLKYDFLTNKFEFKEYEVQRETKALVYLEAENHHDFPEYRLNRYQLNKYDIYKMTNLSKSKSAYHFEIYGTNRGDMIQRAHQIMKEEIDRCNARIGLMNKHGYDLEVFLNKCDIKEEVSE